MLTLSPGHVPLADFETIWRGSEPVRLADEARERIERSYELVVAAAAGANPIYGINTGFGKLASKQIAPEQTAALQRNLILSHCAGVGEPSSEAVVRLMMVLKLNSLGRGASGVSLGLIDLLEAMLLHRIYPVVPSQGSVGASGDLAPLAHMAAAMMGEGHAALDGDVVPAREALAACGLVPIELGPKEGLALINGTQFSTAYALAGWFEAQRVLQGAVLSSALTMDAAMASTAPLHPMIHELRGHPGQIIVAETIRALIEGSEIREAHRHDDQRVQDPYCLRCQPQVTGAAFDLLSQAAVTLTREANAATDNPLVLAEDERIVSGGNFHAEPVAFAADIIALALSEIGAIAQRRIALLVDPALSHGLPAFLAADAGLNSGMMIAEVTSAALMSENKHLANPCSTDSTPTSANQEDHVSMAAHGARRLEKMSANLAVIIGIETFCAIEGIGYRGPLKTSPQLMRVVEAFRQHVTALTKDRLIAPDLEKAASLVRGGGLLAVTGIEFPKWRGTP